MINKKKLKDRLQSFLDSSGLPAFVYGSEVGFINEVCKELFDEFNIAEKIQLDLSSISEVRDLIGFLNATPIYGKQKLVLLNDAQKWSNGVKSALLKSLEEHPSYNKIIITSSSILDLTIMSRCYKIHISSDLLSKTCNIDEVSRIEDPNVLFACMKDYLEKIILCNNFNLLAYAEDLWDKVNETYSWFRKGEISSQNCIQIMSNLILDHLNQINSL
ncbi:hypothetical protein FZC35_00140 [Candidatus Cytomitobacter indipagum]|uniref:DNA polymerase III subunit delta n=1 Tax=Candidatus Cytomitobacter indipagum TaxID=2601575 RepID=A0A5C0UCR7_9PROT|nr:hypothetical protein [Candidatus Cytomitobacter indipagum]QEK37805.1 hypothetical protein FZC35_00140 [Candidatus Cytomitobacter indipagum]